MIWEGSFLLEFMLIFVRNPGDAVSSHIEGATPLYSK